MKSGLQVMEIMDPACCTAQFNDWPVDILCRMSERKSVCKCIHNACGMFACVCV